MNCSQRKNFASFAPFIFFSLQKSSCWKSFVLVQRFYSPNRLFLFKHIRHTHKENPFKIITCSRFMPNLLSSELFSLFFRNLFMAVIASCKGEILRAKNWKFNSKRIESPQIGLRTFKHIKESPFSFMVPNQCSISMSSFLYWGILEIRRLRGGAVNLQINVFLIKYSHLIFRDKIG